MGQDIAQRQAAAAGVQYVRPGSYGPVMTLEQHEAQIAAAEAAATGADSAVPAEAAATTEAAAPVEAAPASDDVKFVSKAFDSLGEADPQIRRQTLVAAIENLQAAGGASVDTVLASAIAQNDPEKAAAALQSSMEAVAAKAAEAAQAAPAPAATPIVEAATKAPDVAESAHNVAETLPDVTKVAAKAANELPSMDAVVHASPEMAKAREEIASLIKVLPRLA
jgi:hypothetical protein